MRITVCGSAGLVLALALAPAAQAASLFYEPFNYATPGKLLDNAEWSEVDAGAANDWDVVAGSLAYPGLETSGNQARWSPGQARRQVSTTLPQAATDAFNSNGTVYLSMLFDDVAGMRIPNSAGNRALNISADQNGFRLLIEPGGGPEPALTLTGTTSGTQLIMIRVVNQAGNDDVRGVANPDLSLGEPDWSALPVIDSADITTDFGELRLILPVAESIRGGIDEFRIGTTFDDVVPEPSALALLAIGGLALLRRR